MAVRRAAERFHDFALALRRDPAIAPQRGKYALMPQVLAPCLQVLGRLAKAVSKLHERIAQAVRVEVGQSGRFKCLPKNPTYWPRAAPVVATNPNRLELVICT